MLVRFCACLLLILVASRPSIAQKRFALLVGNQKYAREVGPLKNPLNDVNLIAASLLKIGFAGRNIHVVKNGNRRTILRAVDRYSRALKSAGSDAVGFFYYSGHGVANSQNRRNYLIPVNVRRLDADVWYDAIRLDQIVTTLQDTASNAAHFVIFDACRNLLNTKTKGSKGFVPVATKRGMLIAFSTDPGQTASDAGSNSGPYAAALAAELVKPGLDHLNLFQNVKETVVSKVNGQVPWERNGLLRRIYLAGRDSGSSEPDRNNQLTGKIDRSASVAIAWNSIKETTNRGYLKRFIAKFPSSVFSEFAKERLRQLGSKSASLSQQAIRDQATNDVFRPPRPPNEVVGDIIDTIRQRGILKAGAKADYRPWGYRNESDSIVGLEVDLLRDVAKALNVKLQLHAVQASNRMQYVVNGQIDMFIATMSDRPDRRKIVGVIKPPYFTSGSNVLSRKTYRLRNWSDLRGKTVCGKQGAFYNKIVSERYGANILAFTSNRAAKQALRNRKCVAWVYDDSSIGSDLASGRWNDYEMPLVSEDDNPWAIAVPKNEARFQKYLSRFVIEWHRSGRLIQLEKKWGLKPLPFLAEKHEFFRSNRPPYKKDNRHIDWLAQ